MYQVSNECRKALDSPGRETDFYCNVTFSDGSTRKIDSSIIKSNSVYIKTKCVSGSDFELGAVCVGEFGVSLLGDSLDSRNYEGAVIKPYCGVKLPDGSFEYIPMGVFNVTEISMPDYRTTTLVCYDNMVKFDTEFYSLISDGKTTEYKKKLIAWLNLICRRCDVNLSEETYANYDSMTNSDIMFYLYTNAPYNTDLKNYTCRDMLMYITQLMCGCAVINRYGKLEIINFDRRYSQQYPDYAKTIGLSQRKSTNIKSRKILDTVSVTASPYNQIYVYPRDSTSSDVLALDENPFLGFKGFEYIESRLKEIADRFQYISYYGAETEIFSDPTIDAGDHILLTGGQAGLGTRILVTKNDWTYRGSHKITSDVSAVQAKPIKNTAASGGSSGGTTQYINNIAYGTCTTAAATAEKVISIADNPNWRLQTGSIVVVKFSYTNTAQNPKLNVNGTGTKSVVYGSDVTTTSYLTAAGEANRYISYLYDGNQFVWIGHSADNNTTYSNASLGQGYGTCSTAEATTAKTAAMMSSYVLSTYGIVSIKFTNAVPAGSTLNINGKGAKAIYHKGSAITDGIIKAGDTATFIYSGQYHHLIAVDRDVATSAEKLTSSAGSDTVPVYFDDGKPKACSYSLSSMCNDIEQNRISVQENTDSIESLKNAVDKKANSDDVYDKTTADNRFLGINDTASKATADENGVNIAESFAAVKNDIALNRTALGYKRKNLLPYPKSIVKGGITFTCDENGYMTGSNKTSDSRTWTSANAQYSMYLEAGTYYFSSFAETVCTNSDGRAYILTGTQTQVVGINTRETHVEKKFTLANSTTIYVIAKVYDGKVAFMIREADITDDSYEPYKPSLFERCLLKDTAGIDLGAAQSSSITIDNLSSYTALWINVAGNVSGINFQTNLVVPVSYLAKSTSNSVRLAGGIPSSAYITSEGPLAAKDMNGTITAKVSGNTLSLAISDGTIGSVEVISLM